MGDQHRGYLLELMLTKLRYAAGEGSSESSSGESSGNSSGKADPAHGLQIVGMSATMPNVGAVADWLQVRKNHNLSVYVYILLSLSCMTLFFRYTSIRELMYRPACLWEL